MRRSQTVTKEREIKYKGMIIFQEQQKKSENSGITSITEGEPRIIFSAKKVLKEGEIKIFFQINKNMHLSHACFQFSVSVNIWRKKRLLLGKGILFLERLQFKTNFKMKD